MSAKPLRNISWSELLIDINLLSNKLKNSINIDWVIAIADGGIIPGTILYKELKLSNFEFCKACRYVGNNSAKDDLNIIKVPNNLSGNILLFDEMVDEGVTLDKMKKALINSNSKINNVYTAVLYVNPNSKIEPDFFVKNYDPSYWLVFPWEVDENEPKTSSTLKEEDKVLC